MRENTAPRNEPESIYAVMSGSRHTGADAAHKGCCFDCACQCPTPRGRGGPSTPLSGGSCRVYTTAHTHSMRGVAPIMARLLLLYCLALLTGSRSLLTQMVTPKTAARQRTRATLGQELGVRECHCEKRPLKSRRQTVRVFLKERLCALSQNMCLTGSPKIGCSPPPGAMALAPWKRSTSATREAPRTSRLSRVATPTVSWHRSQASTC